MILMDKNKCCGCGACAYVCPRHAIEMIQDDYGVMYASVNNALCLNCERCQKVCPIRQEQNKKLSLPEAYAAVCTAPLAKQSTSGGIFAILAKHVIEDGGEVFATTMTNDLQVKVIGIHNINDIPLLQGSKYVQSNAINSYAEIKACLDAGKKVLFAGTPCQVAAVRQVFSFEKNLYLVDIICHGVPNAKLFSDSVADLQRHYSYKITQICFRDARYGQRLIGSILFENGKRKKLPAYKYPYFSLFLKNSILTSACHQCQFASPFRYGDITIGDYWGAHMYEKEFYISCIERGFRKISAVLINNQKGNELFHAIQEDLLYTYTDIEKIKERNPPLYMSSKPNKDRTFCFEIYQKGGYAALKEYYFKKYRCSNIKSALYAMLPNHIVDFLKKGRKF